VAAVDWKDLLAGPSSEAEAGVGERVPGEHIAWSGAGGSISGVVRFVGHRLQIAYDEAETRKFLRLRALALLLTVGAALAAVVGVGAMGPSSWAGERPDLVVVANLAETLGTFGEIAVTVLRWPVLAALAALILAVLYRYAPDRDAAAWRWVTPGAVVATLLWLVASVGFSIYVRNFGSYNETYGSLAAVVVLLLWLFLTAYAVVFGAELDSEAERQTVKDST